MGQSCLPKEPAYDVLCSLDSSLKFTFFMESKLRTAHHMLYLPACLSVETKGLNRGRPWISRFVLLRRGHTQSAPDVLCFGASRERLYVT